MDPVSYAGKKRRCDRHPGLNKSELSVVRPRAPNTSSVGGDVRLGATCAPVQLEGLELQDLLFPDSADIPDFVYKRI